MMQSPLLEQRRQRLERLRHRRAGRHHHPDVPRRLQLRDERLPGSPPGSHLPTSAPARRPGCGRRRRPRGRRAAGAATCSRPSVPRPTMPSCTLVHRRPATEHRLDRVRRRGAGWRSRRRPGAAARPAAGATAAPASRRCACACLSVLKVYGAPGMSRSTVVFAGDLQEDARCPARPCAAARSSAGSADRSRSSSPRGCCPHGDCAVAPAAGRALPSAGCRP